MTLNQSFEYVADHDTQLLGLLAEMRLAVCRNIATHRLPFSTPAEVKAAENAQTRAGLAYDAAYIRVYRLLTRGLDDIIDREIGEVRDAKGEALGSSH